MASLRRHPNSKFWVLCVTIDGRQTQRSSKTKDRRVALRLALELENAAILARRDQLVEAQARKILSDIYSIANDGRQLPAMDTGTFLGNWLASKSVESPAAAKRYTIPINAFIKFLGRDADRDLVHVDVATITKFRDDLTERVGPSTTNFSMKTLKACFEQARRQGLLMTNPADTIRPLKYAKFQRRPFSLDELKKVLAVADSEWRGLILFGIYSGQRLHDLANLTWSNIDLNIGELALTTAKTRRRILIPLAKVLADHLQSMPGNKAPTDPLFPNLTGKTTNKLSDKFYDLLSQAGLVTARPKGHPSQGIGRSGKRQVSEISFHSLRYTTTSLLKNAGVSESVVMDIVGHNSAAMSRHYTRIEMNTKRAGIDKLPDITI